MKKQISLHVVIFLFTGALSLFVAALFAFVASSGPVSLDILSFKLNLNRSDLGGISLFFALIGGGFLTAQMFSKLWISGKVKLYTMVLCLSITFWISLGLLFWPGPLIRLELSPRDTSALVGYRLYFRGLKHGNQSLADYGFYILEGNEGGYSPITCMVSKNYEFGPLGWTRYHARDENFFPRKIKAAEDKLNYCKEGIHLDSWAPDPSVQKILAEFRFKSDEEIDYCIIQAASGSVSHCQEKYNSLANYLLFLKDRTQLQKLTWHDHLYAVYNCDIAYATYLFDMSVPMPDWNFIFFSETGKKKDFFDPVIDSSKWGDRTDPMEAFEKMSPSSVSIAKLNSNKQQCLDIFSFYSSKLESIK